MKTEAFKQRLIAFIQQMCDAGRPGITVSDETRLFEDRLINSIRIIDIMSFVERELKISIPDEKLSMEYFMTPNVIVDAFVAV